MSQGGKKGKKSKGKTIQLNQFLATGLKNDENGGTTVIVANPSSWADEVDDFEDSSSLYSRKKEITLPSAPRSALGSGCPEDTVGYTPPFTASLGNLPYDVLEDDIRNFFSKLQIESIRIPRRNGETGDDVTAVGRGYGFVDFSNRESLIESLSMTGLPVKNRNISIYVNTQNNDRYSRNGGGHEGRGGHSGNKFGDDERTAGDWRSGGNGPSESSRFTGSRDERRGNGYRRDDRPPASKFDSFSRDQMMDVKAETKDHGEKKNFGTGGPGERRNDRFDDRRRNDRFEGARSYRRDNDRFDGPPKERTTIRLTKRSVDAASVPETRNSAIFGLAKPVDTAKKEEEIIEKLKHKEDSTNNISSSVSLSGPSIYGQAKPVSTAARDREIEERLKKKSILDGEDEKRIGSKGGHRRFRQSSKSEESSKKGGGIKKIEDKPPVVTNFVGTNKYEFLQAEDEGVESGTESN